MGRSRQELVGITSQTSATSSKITCYGGGEPRTRMIGQRCGSTCVGVTDGGPAPSVAVCCGCVAKEKEIKDLTQIGPSGLVKHLLNLSFPIVTLCGSLRCLSTRPSKPHQITLINLRTRRKNMICTTDQDALRKSVALSQHVEWKDEGRYSRTPRSSNSFLSSASQADESSLASVGVLV